MLNSVDTFEKLQLYAQSIDDCLIIIGSFLDKSLSVVHKLCKKFLI